jgi:formylglycine-generating enzyme required for sulfatase activity
MKHIAAAAFAFTLTLSATTVASAQCSGDVIPSGNVDGVDLSAVLGAWGSDGSGAYNTDVNGDGVVGGADLTALLASWGPCVPGVPAWATLLESAPNPNVVTSASLRQAISATGLPWRVKHVASEVEMVLIPPGTFNIGCSASDIHQCGGDENPVHMVTITQAFYLGRYEVTQAQWTSALGSNPSYHQSASAEVPQAQVPQRPVEQVSWSDVQNFLMIHNVRLPTEAEWEYAYRAGTTTAFHGRSGNPDGTNQDFMCSQLAWFSTGACQSGACNQTRPVGGKAGNGFGLHDMAGNVWEWVNDRYGSYPIDPQTDPQGPSSGGVNRVRRGGCWQYSSDACRASKREGYWGNGHSWGLGFRVARTP